MIYQSTSLCYGLRLVLYLTSPPTSDFAGWSCLFSIMSSPSPRDPSDQGDGSGLQIGERFVLHQPPQLL